MVEIELTRGFVAIVDEADAARVAGYKWRAHSVGQGRFYAARWERVSGRKVCVLLHRFLMGARPGEWVDHANHDTMDNRRANLRLATPGQNGANRRGWSQSGYKGVYAVGNRWRACITRGKRKRHLGYFDTAIEAALVYDRAARELHGEFALVNFAATVTTIEQARELARAA